MEKLQDLVFLRGTPSLEFCAVVTLNIPHRSTATGHNQRILLTETRHSRRAARFPVSPPIMISAEHEIILAMAAAAEQMV
ncbi:hypothetical protein E2C01_013990 [Portunus trituberculatus]|uniref:Uncharacterized protein n=1 Tax=Portunus trituberculatus TaxID=210409 RepID=A0A5B7DIJ8_PORTR|nr:hypothetical protein [Portunus trituberculatus]